VEATRRLQELAAAHPDVAALRSAASARSPTRLQLAVAHLAGAIRTEMAAALLARRAFRAPDRPLAELEALVSAGAARHRLCSDLLSLGAATFSAAWRWRPEQAALLFANLSQLVGFPLADPPSRLAEAPAPARAGWAHLAECPSVTGLFLAALTQGWPWDLALGAFGFPGGGAISSDCRSFAPDAAPAASGGASLLSLPLGPATVSVYLVNNACVFLRSTARLCPPRTPCASGIRMVHSCRPGRGSFPSLFAPDYIRIHPDADGVVRPPDFQVGSLYDARHKWDRLVGPLSGEARAVLSGFMQYPRTSHAAFVARSRNHASWTDNAPARKALGPKLGGYIYSGVLETVDPRFPAPAIVEPLGVVPKNGDPPFRLITDSRRGNKSLAKWPVKFTTVASLVRRVQYGDFGIGSDVRDAYHCFPKGGCGGGAYSVRMVFVRRNGSREWRKVTRLGCTPGTCTGTCDKARSGVDLDGMLARFATSHFGETPAGSPLGVLMLELRRHFARRSPPSLRGQVDSASWVDDLLLLFKSVYHGRCGGTLAGCPTCLRTKLLADELEDYWLWLAAELGLPLSADKRQRASQIWEYSGILFDSIRGLLLIPDRKLAKVMASLTEVAGALHITARALASVAGRLLHYSLCIRHLRPFIPSFWAIVGCEGEPDYDRTITVSAELRSLCTYLLSSVSVYAPRGVTMWPFVASSLYAALLRGDASAARVRVITYDASIKSGWGAGLQTSEDPSLRIFSGTYPPGTDRSVQVHNEGHAGALALAAAERLADLSDSVIILRNDCAPALSALEFGSTRSPPLQEHAMTIARLCASHNATCLFLHVPGTSLVSEGIDAASRAGAEAERGPACAPALRDTIHAFAARHGWSISVDLFATAENAIAPRFFSRYPEPTAEAFDALSVPSWNASPCPFCSRCHREVFFAFPPPALLPQFIAKAKADGARGLVLTPTAITGDHWGSLLRASVPVDGNSYLAIKHPRRLLHHAGTFSASELALFAVDFGPVASDSRPLSPPCPLSYSARPHAPPPSLPSDPALAAVRHDLQRSLHPRALPPDPPPDL
jgi:hypothetical protein